MFHTCWAADDFDSWRESWIAFAMSSSSCWFETTFGSFGIAVELLFLCCENWLVDYKKRIRMFLRIWMYHLIGLILQIILTSLELLVFEKSIPSFWSWLYKLGINASCGSPLKSPSAHLRSMLFSFSCTLKYKFVKYNDYFAGFLTLYNLLEL